MHEEPTLEMSQEDRFKAVLYQFITLYERWAEDRQLGAKQGADTAELIKLFSAQVQDFKTAESKLRQSLLITLQQSATTAAKEMTEKISEIATDKVDTSTKRLQQVVETTTQTLTAHQQQIDHWFYGWVAGIFGAAIIVALLVALIITHFSMPKPYLPLTGAQLQTYEHGQLFEAFWSKLSKKEKNRLISLVNAKDTIQASDTDNSSDNSDNG